MLEEEIRREELDSWKASVVVENEQKRRQARTSGHSRFSSQRYYSPHFFAFTMTSWTKNDAAVAPYVDPTPLPPSIPSVQEVGTTSAPLKSAAFFIGAYCKDFNGPSFTAILLLKHCLLTSLFALPKLLLKCTSFRRAPSILGTVTNDVCRGLHALQSGEPES